MTATYHNHIATITWEPAQGPKLLSPDGTLQLLPCDGGCGTALWVAPNVVSTLCDNCMALLSPCPECGTARPVPGRPGWATCDCTDQPWNLAAIR
jgi:hypothetical protein